MDKTFIKARIEITKALIIAYEDALIALAHGVESYTLDTGQSRQIVTRFDITDMNKIVDSLYNRCVTLEARLNGSGVVTARPSW
jgi:hypothetical protein